MLKELSILTSIDYGADYRLFRAKLESYWKATEPMLTASGDAVAPIEGGVMTKEEKMKTCTCYNCGKVGHISADCQGGKSAKF